jgi:hypothetical protein
VLKIPVSKGFSHRIANLEIEPFDHAGVFGLIKGQSFYTNSPCNLALAGYYTLHATGTMAGGVA